MAFVNNYYYDTGYDCPSHPLLKNSVVNPHFYEPIFYRDVLIGLYLNAIFCNDRMTGFCFVIVLVIFSILIIFANLDMVVSCIFTSYIDLNYRFVVSLDG